jgi:hypothetical protein
MRHEEDKRDLGSGFGDEAADHIERRAQDYCTAERERIALANEPRITTLNIEGIWLTKHGRELEERLRLAPPSGDLRQRRRSIFFHWFTGIALTLAAFVFSLIAFDPFRLGPKAWLYCIGIAVVTPFATERFLEVWRSEKLLKAIVTAVFIAAITGGVLLAVIRGDLLSREAEQSAPAVVIDGAAPAQTEPQDNFYQSTDKLLRALMVLLTVAIDLGAGIAIHRALELGTAAGEARAELVHELIEVRTHLAEIIFEIRALANAPAIFEKRFWRDYYRAMLTQTARKSLIKLLGVVLCVFLLGEGRASAQQKLNVVVALDLSASESVKDRDGRTEFQANIDAVGRLLTTMPSSAKVTIIGITENSFADHYILLSAVTSEDPGYFGERLADARRQLFGAWRKRSSRLKPSALQTDILGALCVASELLRNGPVGARRLLVVYSDMRNATSALNLETRKMLDLKSIVRDLDERQLLAYLQGTSVYIMAVDAVGQNPARWNMVRAFWTEYFNKASARLLEYSALRETTTHVF